MTQPTSKPMLIKTYNIPGGIHPPENKVQSMQLPLGEIAIPNELVFPLNQHIGTPADPIVNVGDTVLAGEKIAEAVGGLSVPVHASTSGTISAIEDRVLPHTAGITGPCIVLTSDGQHKTIAYTEVKDYHSLQPSQLIEKIRDAGIAGLGGAGFPTAIKLNPSGGIEGQNTINTLILNGTECEPYITADDRLMQDYADDVVAGAELLAFILGSPQRVVIGIEDNKPNAIKAIQTAAQGSSVEVSVFPTKYPSGGEKQLIQILTGQEVASGTIPASLGIVVQNVGTAMAAYRAVRYGEPLTWRITTCVGEALHTQRNIKVLLGTPVQHMLSENGFNATQASRLIMGGPMMGFALPNTDVPIVKTTNCIIAPSQSEMPEPPPAQACIRCGLCAEACPASLLPQQLYWYAKAEEYERLQNHNLFDCIECGACSYVCPSAIPLVQYYRAAKGVIRYQEQEKIKSDHARQRFEFRKLRIERAEQEKEEKRQARKQAAEKAKRLAAEKKAAAAASGEADASKNTAQDAGADPVAAAIAKMQAKAQDPAAEKAKLERAVSSAQSRFEKLESRFIDAEEDQREKLEAQLKQAEVRLKDAKKNLSHFLEAQILETQIESTKPEKPKSPEKADSETNKLKPADEKSLDAAAAAIERAKAKSEAMASMSQEDKLKTQLASLEARVQKAREKLQKAEAEGSEHISAFRTGLEKMETKLATTQKELETLKESN